MTDQEKLEIIIEIESDRKMQATKLFKDVVDIASEIMCRAQIAIAPKTIVEIVERQECQIESLERQKEALKRCNDRQCKTLEFCQTESRVNLRDMTRKHNRAVDKAAELTQMKEKLTSEAETRVRVMDDLRERRENDAATIDRLSQRVDDLGRKLAVTLQPYSLKEKNVDFEEAKIEIDELYSKQEALEASVEELGAMLEQAQRMHKLAGFDRVYWRKKYFTLKDTIHKLSIVKEDK